MKLIALQILLICTVAWGIGMGTVRAETPTEAVDRVWNAYSSVDQKKEGNFPLRFLKLSLIVAKEQGVAVIPPIMVRSKDWKSEEGLIFSILVDFLPRKEATAALQRYQKEGKSWEQQAAADFLTEFEQEDVREMVRKYTTTPSETPAAALDQIIKAWNAQLASGISPDNLILQKDFIHLSHQIALEQGSDIVPALLARIDDWHGKYPMPFTSLLWFVPWQESAGAAADFKAKGNPQERQAAIELLAELNRTWPKALIVMSEAERNKLMEGIYP